MLLHDIIVMFILKCATCAAAVWGGSCSPGCVLLDLRAGVWGCLWRTPAGPAEQSWWARQHNRGHAWRRSAAAPVYGWMSAGKPCYSPAEQTASRLSPHSPVRSPAPTRITHFCTHTKTHLLIRWCSLKDEKSHNIDGGTWRQNEIYTKILRDHQSISAPQIHWCGYRLIPVAVT